MTKRQGYFLIGAVWLLIAVHFEGCDTTKERIAFIAFCGIAGIFLGTGVDTKDT